MKWLVIGCGSIGKRHIRNLQTLNAGEIIAQDVKPDRCREVEREYGVKAYNDLEEALGEKPQVALICTPTSWHVASALAAARRRCHLFIEKPLSHSLEKIDELIDVVEKKKLVTLVGCNMRFHPGIVKMKELLDSGGIGKVLCARVQAGQYLPDWHPWEDYRKCYSANKSLGGGVILDGIHEIDYVRWFLGEVEQVFSFSGKFSSLEINTEDMAEILLKFKSGSVAEVHLDYLQRFYGRSCQLIGEEGTILWDFHEKQVKLYSAKSEKWETFSQDPAYDINQMYVDEIKHFIFCLQGKARPMQDIKEGKKVLEIALAAKKSASRGKLMDIRIHE